MEINENGQHLHGWQEALRVRNHKRCLTGSAQGASQLQCEAEANRNALRQEEKTTKEARY